MRQSQRKGNFREPIATANVKPNRITNYFRLRKKLRPRQYLAKEYRMETIENCICSYSLHYTFEKPCSESTRKKKPSDIFTRDIKINERSVPCFLQEQENPSAECNTCSHDYILSFGPVKRRELFNYKWIKKRGQVAKISSSKTGTLGTASCISGANDYR